MELSEEKFIQLFYQVSGDHQESCSVYIKVRLLKSYKKALKYQLDGMSLGYQQTMSRASQHEAIAQHSLSVLSSSQKYAIHECNFSSYQHYEISRNSFFAFCAQLNLLCLLSFSFFDAITYRTEAKLRS
jgi:hypothetical protein